MRKTFLATIARFVSLFNTMSRMISQVLIIFAVVITNPCVGSAMSVTNTFLTSTSGTSSLEVSDTIQFEVTLTIDAGQEFDVGIWSLSGDAVGAFGSTLASGWAGVSNVVTSWEWNYTPPGGGKVKMGTNGMVAPLTPPLPTPGRVSGGYGWIASLNTPSSRFGDGIPALVGTVTIHADSLGTFQGGAIQYPQVDGFYLGGEGDIAPVSGGSFTVHTPEPSSALLLAAGLGGMVIARRRRP